jgi:hypothetical protein
MLGVIVGESLVKYQHLTPEVTCIYVLQLSVRQAFATVYKDLRYRIDNKGFD